MIEVLREGKKAGKLLYDDVPGTAPVLYGIGTKPEFRGQGVATEALKDLHGKYMAPDRLRQMEISHIEDEAEPFWETWSKRNPDSPLSGKINEGLEQKTAMQQWREQQAKKKSGFKKWLGLGAVPAAVGMGYYGYPQGFIPQPLYPQET